MQYKMVPDLKPGSSPVIALVPVRENNAPIYSQVGEQAYREHYLHLWPNQDPSPYIEKSFLPKVLSMELEDRDNLLYLIRSGKDTVGIAKLVRNRNLPDIEMTKPVFLEKIYLLKAFTGKGLGAQVLTALHELSRKEGMEYIYLVTMKKGKPLSFYVKMGYQILKEEVLPFENAIPEERGMYLLGRSLKQDS